MRYAHQLHGLHPLRPDISHAPETPWRGQPIAFQWGELHVQLTPRALVDAVPTPR